MKDEELIKRRIFSVIPSSSLHMMELLKIMNIRFVDDDEVTSAAVTCTSRPELLINKNFVDQYCKTDEHLFMLIMHELYHIILGHTNLFKRHSQIDNIAFDAVINALLCRSFPGEEYVSFFKGINPDDSFPGCILRPIGDNTPDIFIPVLKSLYFTTTGTYYEVYQTISSQLEELLNEGKVRFVLLGNHSGDESVNNPLIKEMLGDIISKWPRQLVVGGRDLGVELQKENIKYQTPEKKNKKKMEKLLYKSGVIKGVTQSNRVSVKENKREAITFVPNYKDRTVLSKTMLYGKPLLFTNENSQKVIYKESNLKTLVYLDVSGSVLSDIKKFAPLLLKPYKEKRCLLFVFSTKVVPVTYQEFKEGKFKSTGGTLIDCVFEHYFNLPKKQQTKRVLILTDGEVGPIKEKHLRLIKDNNVLIYCGLFGDFTRKDMEEYVKYFEEFN